MKKTVLITLIVGLLTGFSVLGMAASDTTILHAMVNDVVSVNVPSELSINADYDSSDESAPQTINYTNTNDSGLILTADIEPSDLPNIPSGEFYIKIKGGEESSWVVLAIGKDDMNVATLESGIANVSDSIDNVVVQLDATCLDADYSEIGNGVEYIITFTLS